MLWPSLCWRETDAARSGRPRVTVVQAADSGKCDDFACTGRFDVACDRRIAAERHVWSVPVVVVDVVADQAEMSLAYPAEAIAEQPVAPRRTAPLLQPRGRMRRSDSFPDTTGSRKKTRARGHYGDLAHDARRTRYRKHLGLGTCEYATPRVLDRKQIPTQLGSSPRKTLRSRIPRLNLLPPRSPRARYVRASDSALRRRKSCVRQDPARFAAAQ